MRSLVVVDLKELVEPLLLTVQCLFGRPCGLGFERSMHPLVRAVLLRMTRREALDPKAEADRPKRQRESLARPGDPNGLPLSDRQDRPTKAVLAKDALERTARVRARVRWIRVAGEQASAHVIDDRERITVAVIAEQELPLVVDRHQIVRPSWLAARAQRMCRW